MNFCRIEVLIKLKGEVSVRTKHCFESILFFKLVSNIGVFMNIITKRITP